jgi:hypothetical protein
MKPLIRLTLNVLAAAVVLGGMVLSWPGFGQGAGEWARGQRNKGRTRPLAPPSDECQIVIRRIAGKQRVVERLLEGELSLLEAAATFRSLSDNPPEFPCPFRLGTPGRSDGEKACQHLIRWLESYLLSRITRSQATEIVCRYQAELDALLVENEEITLPW